MQKILALLASIFSRSVQYGALVNTAVKQVETETAGQNMTGDTKKQIAVTYVLAAAHAGEQVPVGAVQLISGLVDTAVHVLNTLGIFTTKTTTQPTLPAAAVAGN